MQLVRLVLIGATASWAWSTLWIASRATGPARLGWLATQASWAALGLLIVVGTGPERLAPGLSWSFGLLTALNVIAYWRREAIDRKLGRIAIGKRLAPTFLTVGMVIVLLACGEVVARVAVKLRLVDLDTATRTVFLTDGADDWRALHLTADAQREFDPLLLWRPVAAYPYNAQHVRATIDLSLPKPAGQKRVLALGDSHTDGPPDGAWPEALEDALKQDGTDWRVINAGVVGYTSWQGVRRLDETLAFEPDVVVVCFGWNDAATSTAPPDSSYRVPSGASVALGRIALRYKLILVARSIPARLGSGQSSGQAVARVSIPEFQENLEAMRARASERGIPFILMTRPVNASAWPNRQAPGWRAQVGAYREAALTWAEKHADVIVFDAYEMMKDASKVFVDECHLDADGHRMVGDALVEIVRGL